VARRGKPGVLCPRGGYKCDAQVSPEGIDRSCLIFTGHREYYDFSTMNSHPPRHPLGDRREAICGCVAAFSLERCEGEKSERGAGRLAGFGYGVRRKNGGRSRWFVPSLGGREGSSFQRLLAGALPTAVASPLADANRKVFNAALILGRTKVLSWTLLSPSWAGYGS